MTDVTYETTGPAPRRTQTGNVAITLEMALYALLIFGALVFRLAALDSVPLSPDEAPDALTAWRSVAPFYDADALDLTGIESPTVFWVQKLAFMLLGDTELAARVVTALAGTALAFAPLLFRDLLGRTRTLSFCLLLAFSPVLMLASRSSADMVWALLFAALALWAVKRYWLHQGSGDAVTATVFAMSLVLLAGPGGLMLALILLVAGAAALTLRAYNRTVTYSETDEDEPDPVTEGAFAPLRARLMEWPVVTALLISAGVLAAVTTGFMTFPAGLSTVGGVINGFFGGFSPDLTTPAFHPLLTALFYEPLLWVFAIAALLLMRQNRATLVDRFLLAWLAVGLIVIVFYRGGEAQHALWITIPLTGLASLAVAHLFYDDRIQALWVDETDEDIARLYSVGWGRWLVTIAALALFTMLSLHLGFLGRDFVANDGSLTTYANRLVTGPSADLRIGSLWTVITSLFLIVGYFLAASIWGRLTAWQGMGLGFLGFMLIGGLASGWSGAVSEAHNPVEVWHPNATSRQYPLLRDTLIDLTLRESAGYPFLNVTVVEDPANGITENGLAGWLVRDFPNATFVESADAARGAEVVLLAQRTSAGEIAGSPLPDLGGNYVGQDFTLIRTWPVASLQGMDFLGWWLQRLTREDPQAISRAALWVRQDVFDSNTEPSG